MSCGQCLAPQMPWYVGHARCVNGPWPEPSGQARAWRLIGPDHELMMAQELLWNRLPGPFDDAWEHCKRNFSDLPERVVVTQGEELCAQPVFLERTNQRRVLKASQASRNDPLMEALVNVDYNMLLVSLQTHDPLSWHCGTRFLQQQWFVHRPSWGCYRGDTPMPMHACLSDGATKVKRPFWDDRLLMAEELESSLFTVHLDVLADRKVALDAPTPAPGLLGDGRGTPSASQYMTSQDQGHHLTNPSPPEHRIPFHRRVVSKVKLPNPKHRIMPDDNEETNQGSPRCVSFFCARLAPETIQALRPFQRDSDNKDMTVKRRKCTRL